ncbi:MAG: prolipoprotein diacylglyceryl transferase [Bacillales bacterium]
MNFDLIHKITLISSILAFVISIILFIIPTRKIYLKNNILNIDFIKKEFRFYIPSLIIFVVGSLLFTLQFHSNPFNRDYIFNDLKTTIKPIHFVFIYLGSVLSGITFYIMSSSILVLAIFRINVNKYKKLVIFTAISVFIFLISFIIHIEGWADYIRYPLCNRIYIGIDGIKLTTVNTGYDWAIKPDGKGIEIALYAICILIGALTTLFITNLQIRRVYKDSSFLLTVFVIGLPLGIVGARLWYVVGNFYREGFDKNISAIFDFKNGGLTIMGASLGIIGGVFYLLYMKYKIKDKLFVSMNYLILLDFIVPAILLAQVIGRYGNFFNNEVHGNLVNNSNLLLRIISNNMKFSSVKPIFSNEQYHVALNSNKIYAPLFLVEGALNFINYLFIEFGLIYLFRNCSKINKTIKNIITPEGCGLSYYFISYGTTRFILEPLRDNNFNMGSNNKWSTYNSLVMLIIGLLILLFLIIWQFKRDKGQWILKVKDKKINA